MTSAEAAPRSCQRWSRTVLPLVMLSRMAAALADCTGTECTDTRYTELLSPDGKHTAIQLSKLCNTGLGFNNSFGESVLVDVRPGARLAENEVFVTFDSPPSLQWLSSDTLEITVNAVNTINVSRDSAQGVKIIYRMREGLTETAIMKQLAEEQRHTSEIFKDDQSLVNKLNTNARQRFEAFLRWAKEYAALKP